MVRAGRLARIRVARATHPACWRASPPWWPTPAPTSTRCTTSAPSRRCRRRTSRWNWCCRRATLRGNGSRRPAALGPDGPVPHVRRLGKQIYRQVEARARTAGWPEAAGQHRRRRPAPGAAGRQRRPARSRPPLGLRVAAGRRGRPPGAWPRTAPADAGAVGPDRRKDSLAGAGHPGAGRAQGACLAGHRHHARAAASRCSCWTRCAWRRTRCRPEGEALLAGAWQPLIARRHHQPAAGRRGTAAAAPSGCRTASASSSTSTAYEVPIGRAAVRTDRKRVFDGFFGTLKVGRRQRWARR
jgi:hypothetical protein